jgi:hypothetical protein
MANFLNYEELNMQLIEPEFKHFMNIDEILSPSNPIENEDYIPYRSIFKLSLNNENEEEVETIPNSLHINEEEDETSLLNDKYYPIDKIKGILELNNIPKDILDRIRCKSIRTKDIENILNPKNMFKIIKKRVKKVETDETEKENLQCGRSKKDDDSIKKHNKDSEDNIIRKIKVCILKYLIDYCNIHISKEILHLDYKYKSNLKKDINIIMLNSSLKEILSYEISSKYGQGIQNHNKNVIDDILKKEANNEKIKTLLEMKLNKWIDEIFLFKENSGDNKKFKGLESTLLYIIKKFPNDNDYLTRFLFYLYNFSNWFGNKKGRNENN